MKSELNPPYSAELEALKGAGKVINGISALCNSCGL